MQEHTDPEPEATPEAGEAEPTLNPDPQEPPAEDEPEPAPTPSGPVIELTVETAKSRGLNVATLGWDGTDAAALDVHVNGGRLTATANTGGFVHETGTRGSPTFEYQVCEVDTQVCSPIVTISSW